MTDSRITKSLSPLSFCVLGSGSSGNCTVVLTANASESVAHKPGVFLLDAGLSPRRTRLLLDDRGLSLDDVAAIALTHLDSDHFHAGWLTIIMARAETEHPLRVCVHRKHRKEAWRAGLTARETELFDDHLVLPGGAIALPLLLAHDDVGSVGFVIEHARHRLGYATDLGRVPDALIDRFVNLHALCIESNYDPQMQEASDRPAFLKQRIMGGRGHLSNQQALEAAREIERRSALSHIALLHLSRECNCPKRIARLWKRELPGAMERLTITSQRLPTPLLQVKASPASLCTVELKPVTQPSLFEVG